MKRHFCIAPLHSKARGALCIAVLMLLSPAIHALELTELKVNSALNQPLQAEIMIDMISAGSEGVMTVGLASRQSHRDAGLEYDPSLSDLEFRLDRDSLPPKIILSTLRPVTTPFFRFLIDFQYQDQRLFRDYTAMLDPIDLKAEGAALLPSALGTVVPASARQTVYPGERYGPVSEGDTLMGIARAVSVDEALSVKQRMVALFEDNPDAFIDENMNLLKAGAYLHVPSERFMQTKAPEAAAEIYESHLVSWLHRRVGTEALTSTSTWTEVDNLTTGQGPSTAIATEYVLRIVSPAESISAKRVVEDAAAAGGAVAVGTSDQQLEPVTSPVGTNSSGERDDAINALSDRMVLIEEALGGKVIENEALTEQVMLLERQLEKTMQLIELQETQLALAQQQLEQMQKAQEQEMVAAAQVERSKPATTPAPTPAAGSEGVVSGPAQKAAPKPEASDPALGLASNKNPQQVPPPWEDPGRSLDWVKQVTAGLFVGLTAFLSEVGSPSSVDGAVLGLDLSVLLGLVALLILLWALLRARRKRRGPAERAGSRREDHGERKRSLFTRPEASETSDSASPPAPEAPDSVGAGFVTEIETQRGVAVNSEDVDPLTEAEIFLAYGRGKQAEETLRYAVSRAPNRVDLKLKLLEVYQSLGRTAEFSKLSEELQQTLDPGSPEAAHLASLSAKTAPFDTSLPGKENPPETMVAQTAAQAKENDRSTPQAVSDDFDGIAFDLTDEPQSRALGSATPVDGVKASKEASPPTESVDDGIDFEFDSVSPAKGSEVPLKSDEKGDGVADQEDPVDPDSDLELLRADPPEGEILVAEDDDPVARLDIAEAYLQIGDVEAAREILEALDGHQDEQVRSRRQALVDRL